MADNIPQWPFIPAIEGQVPMPRTDPRSAQAKSLEIAKALMAKPATSAAPTVPTPRPDPRSWTDRAVSPHLQTEDYSQGAIHPDALMKTQGYDFKGQTPDSGFQYPELPMGMDPHQMPLGMPQPRMEQDAGQFLNYPPDKLQQMAATAKPDQNLPKLPQSGFVPSLSPMYMNDKGLGAPPAPNLPPIFWQPG